jgi:hypothetical protein
MWRFHSPKMGKRFVHYQSKRLLLCSFFTIHPGKTTTNPQNFLLGWDLRCH